MAKRREFLDVIHVLRNRLDFIERCIGICAQPKSQSGWIILDENTLLSDHSIALPWYEIGQSIT